MLRQSGLGFAHPPALSALRKHGAWALPLLSGVLLFLVCPGPGLSWLAFFALLPLFASLENAATKGQAFRRGFLCGLGFHIPGLYWFIYVAVPGWIFGSALEALFLGFFALLCFSFRRVNPGLLRILWMAAAWALCEWLRSEIPVFGFGWNLLGTSQWKQNVLLQSANVLGIYGLGFYIVFINASLWEAIKAWRARQRMACILIFAAALLATAVVVIHGRRTLEPQQPAGENFRVSVIQGNIPEAIKWHPDAREKIMEIHLKLSQLSAFESPDLIVWPEASFPGYFNKDVEAQSIRELSAKTGASILVGSPHYETAGIYYNSTYLVPPKMGAEERYDKIKLVPFGEYVPLKFLFGWLMPLADAFGVGDFSAGRDYKLFHLYEGVPFATLICFEDTFPMLTHEFARRGAHFLVVVTNDSWFGPSPAPYQHLAASVFRAVETGLPIARAANTGVSAFISPRGKVFGTVHSKEGKELFAAGHATGVLETGVGATAYVRYGYLFPYANVFFMLLLFSAGWLSVKLSEKPAV